MKRRAIKNMKQTAVPAIRVSLNKTPNGIIFGTGNENHKAISRWKNNSTSEIDLFVVDWMRNVLETSDVGSSKVQTYIPTLSKDFYYTSPDQIVKKYCFNKSSEQVCMKVVSKAKSHSETPFKLRIYRIGENSDVDESNVNLHFPRGEENSKIYDSNDNLDPLENEISLKTKDPGTHLNLTRSNAAQGSLKQKDKHDTKRYGALDRIYTYLNEPKKDLRKEMLRKRNGKGKRMSKKQNDLFLGKKEKYTPFTEAGISWRYKKPSKNLMRRSLREVPNDKEFKPKHEAVFLKSIKHNSKRDTSKRNVSIIYNTNITSMENSKPDKAVNNVKTVRRKQKYKKLNGTADLDRKVGKKFEKEAKKASEDRKDDSKINKMRKKLFFKRRQKRDDDEEEKDKKEDDKGDDGDKKEEDKGDDGDKKEEDNGDDGDKKEENNGDEDNKEEDKGDDDKKEEDKGDDADKGGDEDKKEEDKGDDEDKKENEDEGEKDEDDDEKDEDDDEKYEDDDEKDEDDDEEESDDDDEKDEEDDDDDEESDEDKEDDEEEDDDKDDDESDEEEDDDRDDDEEEDEDDEKKNIDEEDWEVPDMIPEDEDYIADNDYNEYGDEYDDNVYNEDYHDHSEDKKNKCRLPSPLKTSEVLCKVLPKEM
ncbi:hypothetical protein TNIN_237261 [Trichonephila inaurata madagascariensis]|uniref:Uncharacterized protein n=1 Tax=Trichonephila inaurata madagascariensis TaxID=2747483 RepID=A0A8X6YPY2_9ARAC|nr:hypothetical protein TNIN_237261 [Trichonephila inaurata madagascariensis]